MFTAMRTKYLALAAAALLGSAGAANAEVVFNASGNLTYTTPKEAGKHFAMHNVFLKAGQKYIINMSSMHFDTYLRLKSPGGLLIKQDDDSGAKLNSKLTITPMVTGTYHIIATTFSPGATGSYNVRVTRLPFLPPPPKVVLNVEGDLKYSDPVVAGKHFHTYKVFMKAGHDYQITLSSPHFDTFLKVQNEFGWVLKQDDDSGPMRDSRLVFRPLISKMYTVVVTSYAPAATGHFRLIVRD